MSKRTYISVCAFAFGLAACAVDGALDDFDDSELATTTGELTTPAAAQPTQVVAAHSDGCLRVAPPQSWLEHAPCEAVGPSGNHHQFWRFEPIYWGPWFSGQYTIRWEHDPTKCLDVPGNNVVAGQDLQIHTCHGGSNQRWSITPVTATHAVIKPSASASLCLDVENAAQGVARVQLFTCGATPTANRLWRFRTLVAPVVDRCPLSETLWVEGHPIAAGQRVGFPVPGPVVEVACGGSLLGNVFANVNFVLAERTFGTEQFGVSCMLE